MWDQYIGNGDGLYNNIEHSMLVPAGIANQIMARQSTNGWRALIITTFAAVVGASIRPGAAIPRRRGKKVP